MILDLIMVLVTFFRVLFLDYQLGLLTLLFLGMFMVAFLNLALYGVTGLKKLRYAEL